MGLLKSQIAKFRHLTPSGGFTKDEVVPQYKKLEKPLTNKSLTKTYHNFAAGL